MSGRQVKLEHAEKGSILYHYTKSNGINGIITYPGNHRRSMPGDYPQDGIEGNVSERFYLCRKRKEPGILCSVIFKMQGQHYHVVRVRQ